MDSVDSQNGEVHTTYTDANAPLGGQATSAQTFHISQRAYSEEYLSGRWVLIKDKFDLSDVPVWAGWKPIKNAVVDPVLSFTNTLTGEQVNLSYMSTRIDYVDESESIPSLNEYASKIWNKEKVQIEETEVELYLGTVYRTREVFCSLA